MPTYVYRRDDGSTFEVEQRISEPALTEDPETGRPVVRVITGAGLLFRGSGFYLTDYARKSGAGKEESKSDSGATSDGASDAGSASKPAAAPAESTPAAPKPAASKTTPAPPSD